jgi:hypothetical protein
MSDLTIDQALRAFAKIGFDPQAHRGTKNICCPSCSQWRRKKTLRCMSIRCEPDSFFFRCFHCDFHGSFRYDDHRADNRRVFRASRNFSGSRREIRDLYGGIRR